MADWILPRRGPPGLNSPFLIECRGAYRVFDRTGSPPRLVVAIGDDEKRRFLQQALNAPIYASGGIALRPLLPSTIVADCDLQNLHELLPIDSRRPRDEDCRHAVLYPPEIHSVQIVELAQELCWQALAPFSCLILFFARDFHGLDPVAHFLSAWVQRAMADPIEAPPRILVVCDELKETQRALIRHLRANLRAAFQALDPRRRVSSSSVNSHYRKAFESVQLLPSIDAETLHLHTEDLFAVRGLRGLAFSSHHLKALLQQVIRDFGRNPRQAFNVYSASRLRNPVAADLSDHVVNLFLASKGSDLDVIPIVASALEFNAHPPGMHFFHPRRTFENFYQAALSRAEGRLALHDLTSRVRQRFVVMAMQRREQSSAQAHLRFLAQQVSWEQCRSDDTCLMCVAQRPSVTLTCEHRLCNPCAIVCSGSGSGPCPVPRCPLCQAENDRAIELRPPTAGLRVLELGGTVHHKLMVLRFLKDVERKIGMRRYPLGKHFDLVVGSEIGTSHEGLVHCHTDLYRRILRADCLLGGLVPGGLRLSLSSTGQP
ncbi:hypothetical protein GQ53DRAFT_865128 [Thozetella sp. PMI_491]|nr:hypothetical protein GQ53DRAFT_865128 [Thozetella sp. PMI_491]